MSLFDLGPEPTWFTCKCGALTSRLPCLGCECEAESKLRAKVYEQEARARGLWSIPKRFHWARLGAPELPMRVGYQGDLKTLSERILGAANAIFQGPSGTGKTSLAVACLQERLLDARFESALRLGTARIQNPAGKGEAEVVTRAIEARLLLIDDVGTEAKTANNAVRDVVFERHDAERPTWITTGFSSQQLADFYGDGFLRRILEGAMVVRLVAK